jgi:hypothetical protein
VLTVMVTGVGGVDGLLPFSESGRDAVVVEMEVMMEGEGVFVRVTVGGRMVVLSLM